MVAVQALCTIAQGKRGHILRYRCFDNTKYTSKSSEAFTLSKHMVVASIAV